ncbi:platelet-derived growth factor subunit A isoform X1 [Octopus sinensis]|uniref:Platelet-derived growth factor subunit A isoform X1 n=1 Tax=Octopus sinensis TaxID=2607531 RepID=A0A6P7T109_9MOLL|nr:platelet-derived growth factor subunit A isoform X1 [Octopus sinensis]
MLRLGVLLLVLIIWVGVTYSAIKNQSVGNGGQLKQANNTYHPSHQLQESARLSSILISEFRKAIKTTHTARELIRLFAGKDATREQIDRILGYELERTYSDRGRFPRMMSGYDDVISGLDKALSHVQEMTSSPLHRCKHPRPEIVYIQDNEAKNRVYFPSCTVIHRCRNVTGCCSNASAVCGPKRVKIISKYFVVLDLTDKKPETANLNSKMVEVRKFMNHTECECKEIIKLPGCRKECPHPFQKVRNGLECVCDCRNDQRNCLLIKDGMKPLNEHSLVCIKRRQCQRPNCRYGYFDVNTGYCPLLQLGNQRKNRRRNRLRLRGKLI